MLLFSVSVLAAAKLINPAAAQCNISNVFGDHMVGLNNRIDTHFFFETLTNRILTEMTETERQTDEHTRGRARSHKHNANVQDVRFYK